MAFCAHLDAMTVRGPISRERLRASLARPAPPRLPEDAHIQELPADARVTEAAVLVPLVSRGAEVHVLLTQRTPHLADHAGQISFPGGRVEEADASRIETALREAEEEIGLARERVEVLGVLPDYTIASGFRVTPVVGWIEPPFELALDAFEVAEAFEAPLGFFLDPANLKRRAYHFNGRHRHYLAMAYEGRYVWGATAGMLYSLYRLLAGD
jgi:8-oxo-dGTP pyrophosphatase MutT (NUDIX family)